jgi:hypothetical protein
MTDGSAYSDQLARSVAGASAHPQPYRYWVLTDVLPDAAVRELAELPFPVPDLHGESGRREVHNATRQYFDAEKMAAHPVCQAVADLFQAPKTIGLAGSTTLICASNTRRTPTASGSSRTPISA